MDSNHRRHKPADLQSAPFGHSGNFPYVLPPLLARPSVVVSRWRDSNPRPPDYKSSALPTELHRHFNRSECKSRYKKCIGKIFCDNFSKIFRQRTAIRTAASRTTEAKSGAKIIQSGELTNFSCKNSSCRPQNRRCRPTGRGCRPGRPHPAASSRQPHIDTAHI